MQNSKCTSKFITILAALLLLACQSSDYSNPANGGSGDKPTPSAPQKPVEETVAEGRINDRAWKFASGAARLFKRKGQVYLDMRLWNQVFAKPCQEFLGSPYQIRLYSEYKVSEATIDPKNPFVVSPKIIFSDLTEISSVRNNMVANKGTIRLTDINGTMVKGWLDGSFAASSVGNTSVSGVFEITLCQQKSDSN